MQSKATGSHLEAVSPNRLPQVGLKDKDLVGIPWMVAFALRAHGWWLRSDIIWSKPNPMPESVTDRPTKAHEYLFLLAKSSRYYFDQEAIREPETGELHDRTRKTRATENQKCAPTELVSGIRRSKMPDGWDTGRGAHGTIHRGGRESGAPAEIRTGRNKRSVWTIPTQPYPEAHFATFPEALVEPCIAAGTKPGDTVLDLFAGSGTVGVVALRAGRDFIGIELNPEYVEMARRRIEGTAPLFARAAGEER
jgi:site-specific DNA-methyltransferase (cytosine-N4-specific)